MTYYVQTQSTDVTERVLAAAAHMFERAAARHAHHRIYRASLTELRTLSDRELEDIGMNRADLKKVALQAADRQVTL